MSSYQRFTAPLACKGISVAGPSDQLAAGKYPFLLNVRAYTPVTLQGRPGLIAVNGVALDQPNVHAIRDLNDGALHVRFIGAGTKLYLTGGAAIDTTYSGDPLTLIPLTPEQSPSPWMYVSDRSRMKAVNSVGTVRNVGIAPTLAPPAVILSTPSYYVIDNLDAVGAWTAVGAYSGALSAPARVNTTIARILYDTGASQWCSIVPAAFGTTIQPGALLTLNAAEVVLVQSVHPACATTTIGSISYDGGATGLCTIQPAASVATGGTPSPRSGGTTSGTASPRAGASGVARQQYPADLEVDACLLIGAGITQEAVRILSVTAGPDGVRSFRCATVNAQAAGGVIAGLLSFRCYTVATFVITNTITTYCVQQTLTMPSPALASITDGIKHTVALNLAVINGRATQAEDEIHLSIQVDRLDYITEGRILIDVDSATNDFTRNYYWVAFRADDLTRALQGVAGQVVSTVLAAQQAALQRDQVDRAASRGRTGSETPDERNPPISRGGTQGQSSDQIGTGASQWLELIFKVSDLQRAGSDESRTLANVAAVRLQVTSTGTVQVAWDALWIGGSYGPDVGTIGAPYQYCSRPRSSVTGVKGNPSPATRVGVLPHRQRVLITPVANADAQADLQDVFRFGGALASWRWVGAVPNTGAAQLADDYPDDAIAGAEELEFDNFQPWPVSDVPHAGVCNVVGTVVTWVSGDHFDLTWAAESAIQINGIAYSLYGSPTSATRLEINENAGTLVNATFQLPEPLLQGRPLPTRWGEVDGYVFACGDTINPGRLYWAKRFNPDAAQDAAFLDVTSASEPLMNGFVLDKRPFVFSSGHLFPIEAYDPAISAWQVHGPVDDEGLWSRWAMAVGNGKCWFLTETGIRVTDGSPSVSITDADLYQLFPHDGQPGVGGMGVRPPDMTQTTKLRLSWCDGLLYFDYADEEGDLWTLLYDPTIQGWFYDQYTPGARLHYAEEGVAVHATLVGGPTGFYYTMGGLADDGTAIFCLVLLPAMDQGDGRGLKLYSDLVLDLDPAGVAIIAQPAFDNYMVYPAVPALAASSGRAQQILPINGSDGQRAHNIGLVLEWSTTTATPVLYLYDYSWQPEAEYRQAWHVPPTTFGLSGWVHLRDAYLTYNSTTILLLTITIDGVAYPYTIPASGGLDTKYYLPVLARKGLLHGLDLLATADARIFENDCELRVKAWGSPDAYEIRRPFSQELITRG